MAARMGVGLRVDGIWRATKKPRRAATVGYWLTVGVCASHLIRYLVCVSDWMGFDGQKKSPRGVGLK